MTETLEQKAENLTELAIATHIGDWRDTVRIAALNGLTAGLRLAREEMAQQMSHITLVAESSVCRWDRRIVELLDGRNYELTKAHPTKRQEVTQMIMERTIGGKSPGELRVPEEIFHGLLNELDEALQQKVARCRAIALNDGVPVEEVIAELGLPTPMSMQSLIEKGIEHTMFLGVAIIPEREEIKI